MTTDPDLIASIRDSVTDYNGAQMADGEQPRRILNCGEMRAIADRLEELTRCPLGYFSSSTEDGFEYHKTEREARARAQDCVNTSMEEAQDGGWDIDNDDVCWGVVRERSRVTGLMHDKLELLAEPKPAQESLARDGLAALAELKAEEARGRGRSQSAGQSSTVR